MPSIFFDKIATINSAKREFSALMTKKAFLLKSGRYVANSTFSVWYSMKKCGGGEDNYILKEQLTKIRNGKKLSETFEKIKRKIIHIIFRDNVVNIKTTDNIFNGDTVILSRTGKDGKIIDHDGGKILSFYENNDVMHSLIEKRKTFEKNGFSVISIDEIDDKNCFYIEKYIDKKFSPIDDVFEFVCRETLRYQKSADCARETGRKDFSVEVIRKYIKDDLKSAAVIAYLRSDDFIKCLCHGDLYRNNVIFDGQRYYYIDFELAGMYVFFFDVIYFMWFEYYRFDNDAFISAFFDGVYDGFFKELFAVNGVSFDSSKRKIYYFITLYEYFYLKFGTKIPDVLISLL